MSLTAEQLALRMTGIGSSEIAAVAGVSPYRSAMDVWLEKMGQAPPFEGNAHTRWGTRLEAVVAEAYAEERKVALATPGTMRHPSHDFVLATPDRFVLGPDGEPTKVLEIKCAGARMAREWGEADDDVPESHILQVTWEMLVSGLPAADLAVLIGGNDFRVYPLSFDAELAGHLVEIGGRFWRDHVLTGKPPKVDASEGWTDYLKRRFPAETGPVIEANADLEQLVRDYRAARAVADEAERAKGELENAIKAAIGSAAGLRGKGFTVTWKASKPSRKIDWEGIAGELKAPEDLVTKFTEERPGSRRFLCRFDKE